MSWKSLAVLITLALTACGTADETATNSTIGEADSDRQAIEDNSTKSPQLTDGNATRLTETMETVKIATSPRVISPDGTVSGATALLTGRLQRAGSCLIIELENGGKVQPVFPEGAASWDAERSELVFNGIRFKIGAEISLGGGGISNDADYRANSKVNIPACEGVRLFVVSG